MNGLNTIKDKSLMESNTEVTTEMKAVLEASYSLSIEEQRILFLAMVVARQKNMAIGVDGKITIDHEIYMQVFNTDKQTACDNLIKAGMDLFERYFEYEDVCSDEGAVIKVKCRWLSSIGVVNTKDYCAIGVGLGVGIIASMNALRRRYEIHGLKQVGGLTGGYALRLYDMLIQWKHVGRTSTFAIEELREQLGLTDEYSAMSDFKKRVLDLAVTKINEHTDIEVSYEQRKKGRVITGFVFKVKSKTHDSAKPRAMLRDINTSDMFTQSGLTDKQLAQIASNPEFKSDYIELVDANHPAYSSASEWQLEMVGRMKDNPSQFNKKPIEEYLS